MIDKFYTQHKFFCQKMAKPTNLRQVFGAAELASGLTASRSSDSPRALKGVQKPNAYLSKFMDSFKNFPIIFPH